MSIDRSIDQSIDRMTEWRTASFADRHPDDRVPLRAVSCVLGGVPAPTIEAMAGMLDPSVKIIAPPSAAKVLEVKTHPYRTSNRIKWMIHSIYLD